MTLNLPVRSLYRRPPLASLQCLCPVPHLAAQAQRAPVQVAPIAVHLRHHLRAAHSRLRMLRAQRQAVQPIHRGPHHPNCLRWSALSTACLRAQEIVKTTSDEKPNGQLERPTAAYCRTEASCQSAAELTMAHLSASSCKYTTSPYPRRRPSDKGSKNQVQVENANAPRKSSDSETDRLQDIQEEPRRRIGPSRVKELAKFFTPTSDEKENSRVNNRTRCKKLFEPKKEEESEK